MSVFGSIGRLDILWSVNKTGSCGYKIGQKHVTNAWRVWSRTFITQVNTNSIVMWKHNTTMQTWIVSRLRFCRRSWGFKINIRWTLVHFRKWHVLAKKLDVQETDFSFTQFNWSWDNFSRGRFTHGRFSRSWSLGFDYRCVSFRTEPNRWTQERATGKPVGNRQVKQA